MLYTRSRVSIKLPHKVRIKKLLSKIEIDELDCGGGRRLPWVDLMQPLINRSITTVKFYTWEGNWVVRVVLLCST